MPQPRVVSLLPSATEIVCALGCGDQLVGRSHECDYPAGVETLPVCTAPRFDPEGSSAEIDRRVKEIVESALSVYRVDGDLLQNLAPDLIVTQTQCEVCAVSPRDLEEVVRTWVGTEPRIVSLAPNALGDVWDDIERTARALDVAARGTAMRAEVQSRAAAVAEVAHRASERPTVACIEWIEPLMCAGNWVPELVEMAGGRDLFGTAGEHAPWTSWEELREADPEVVAMMPCGFDIDRTAAEMPTLSARPGWHELKAVREGRVFITDGNQYFNRPGPRLVDSLEILAELLHPELVRSRYEGIGWIRQRPPPA